MAPYRSIKVAATRCEKKKFCLFFAPNLHPKKCRSITAATIFSVFHLESYS